MTRLYISGPVTGIPENNLAAFLEARGALLGVGYKVTVPHGLVNSGLSHEDAMTICINELTDHSWGDAPLPCYDGMALLPGWEDSRGARLEKLVAEACGIPCKTVDEWMEVAPDGLQARL